MSFIGHCPNGLPQLRLQVAGDVQWILFETKSLLTALAPENYEQLKAKIKDLDFGQLQELASRVKVYYHVQVASEIMYIPAGYIACESAAKGVLLYGVRKACLHKSDVIAENYNGLTEFLGKSGKVVDNMKVVAEWLQEEKDT